MQKPAVRAALDMTSMRVLLAPPTNVTCTGQRQAGRGNMDYYSNLYAKLHIWGAPLQQRARHHRIRVRCITPGAPKG